jgi:RNA polymerase sigma factor (sigma-70 family)
MIPERPACTDHQGERHAPANSRSEDVARLFREHNQALVSFLALRLRSIHEAREVAQEAYVRLLELERRDVSGFLRSYLFRIASNLAVDRVRKRVTETRFSQTEIFDLFADPTDEPERDLLAKEDLRRLSECLAELPEQARQAFLMFRLDGLSQEDIAARLGVTDRMVRKYITRALIHCRLRLDGMALDDVMLRLKA